MNVPTWNYLAVHAYGRGKIISEKAEVVAALKTMITTYEAAYAKQWNRLPDSYQSKMLEGIVAFEVVVSELQSVKKLSQNKTAVERQHIIASLEKSSSESENKSLSICNRKISTAKFRCY